METVDREFELKKLIEAQLPGFSYEVMWEHTFDAEIKKSSEYEQWDSDRPATGEFKIVSERGFFYGGRTNCLQFYAESNASEGRGIRYADVCSLYPYVCKYRDYPKGHPRILRNDLTRPVVE